MLTTSVNVSNELLSPCALTVANVSDIPKIAIAI